MKEFFRQIFAVTHVNLTGIPQRPGSSLVCVAGTAGVVAVLIAVLAMITGLGNTLGKTGRYDRVVVLNSGAPSELSSRLSRDTTDIIADLPGIKRDATGRAIASFEVLTAVSVTRRSNQATTAVTLRGVSGQSELLRPELKVVAGRMFSPGTAEIVVGASAAEQFESLQLGNTIRYDNTDWTVVGTFTSNGDAHESELLTSADTLIAITSGQQFNSVTLQLASPASFQELQDAMSKDRRLFLDAPRETDYYAVQSGTTDTALRIVAWVVGSIMALGAVFAALNTMYSAVNSRIAEIATLRAIGFNAFSVLVSVLAESMLLALIGALAGSFIAWAAFNGNAISIAAGMDGIQLAFKMSVTAALLGQGALWAAIIGLVGGFLPALRAVRIPVAAALRAT